MRIKIFNPAYLTVGGFLISFLGITMETPYKWIVGGVGLLILFTGAYHSNKGLHDLDSRTLKSRTRNRLIVTIIIVGLALFHLMSLLREITLA